MNEQHQRPEGRLLKKAITRDGRSMRRIAGAVGISDTRLRHIVNGYQPVGHGQTIDIVAPADTLAKIAEEVNVSEDEMRAAGRPDAADEMGELASVSHVNSALSISSREDEMRMLREYLDAPEHLRPINPPTKPLSMWSLPQLLEAVAAVYEDERQFLLFATGRGESYPDHFKAEHATRAMPAEGVE